MHRVNEMKELFDQFAVEGEKFAKGNSAAGTRARKVLGEISKLCKVVRNEITLEKNARKEAKQK